VCLFHKRGLLLLLAFPFFLRLGLRLLTLCYRVDAVFAGLFLL
jgi:hypothetical protein